MENVYTIDTQSLSCGISLLILECVEYIKQGLDIKEIIEKIEQLKSKVQASFLVDTLEYLHKGGRCSGVALLGSKLFNIKPKISVINGKMEVVKKYMGTINSASLKYADEILKEVPPNTKRAFIITSSPLDVKEKIMKKCRDYGFEEVIDAQAGPSISIHCGRGTLGIMYLAK